MLVTSAGVERFIMDPACKMGWMAWRLAQPFRYLRHMMCRMPSLQLSWRRQLLSQLLSRPQKLPVGHVRTAARPPTGELYLWLAVASMKAPTPDT